jgi:UDP:flavonoid glycosyltransferase YjiC (YdhE family)
LRFAPKPVDLVDAGRSCDVAILNATHGTTAALLLAGKPSLQIPLYLEQQLTADNVAKMGAGLTAEADRPDRVLEQFERLLADNRFGAAARDFGERYADYKSVDQIDRMVERIERLIPQAVGA